MKPQGVDSMQLLARKASEKEQFLGHILTRYAEENGLQVSEVASRLRCPPENFSILTLCKIPRSSAQFFGLDVRSISEYVDCDAGELANLLRECGTLHAMRKVGGGAVSNDGMLMAARDKKDGRKKADESDENE